jgi:hypothetical protein
MFGESTPNEAFQSAFGVEKTERSASEPLAGSKLVKPVTPKIEHGPPLTDSSERNMRAGAIALVESDPERFLAEYTKRFGNVLNADNAATLFDQYNEKPAKYRVAVHPAAQWIRDELFRRALGERVETGRNRVVFTAGGNASGKSSTVTASGAEAGAQVVLDSTFSNVDHASRLVEDALAAGKAVTIHYVNRPLDNALDGMIDRAGSQGRVVTIDQLIRSQRGAAQTARKLWAEYRTDPRVAFDFLDNAKDKTSVGGIETASPENYTESRQRLNDLLDRQYEEKRISEATYRRIRGSGGERSQPPKGGDRGGPGNGGSEPTSGAETAAKKPSLKPARSTASESTPGSGFGAFEPSCANRTKT